MRHTLLQTLVPLALILSITSAAPWQPAGIIENIQKEMDSPLIDIQWANDETIYVLSEDGTLYRSPDGGRSWKDEQSYTGPITEILISEAEPTKVFFVGQATTSWATTDGGSTYYKVDFHPEPESTKLHPVKSDWLLATRKSEGCYHKKACYEVLYLSQDFGKNWRVLQDYIVQYEWSPVVEPQNKDGSYDSDTLIYASIHTQKKGSQRFDIWDKNVDFVSSADFFNSYSTLVKGGNRFTFGDFSYLFVAAVHPEVSGAVQLQVSRTNSTHSKFIAARLPTRLHQYSYNILDTSESTVFLHVNHDQYEGPSNYGTLYQSDWSGVQFTKVRSRHHRDQDGFCDFDVVEGVQGIYFLNTVDRPKTIDSEEAEEAKGKGKKKKSKKNSSAKVVARTADRLTSLISFDKGQIWRHIAAPKIDSLGNEIACASVKDKSRRCHLHLNGITGSNGPFYSVDSAPGMILATGNVGFWLDSTNVNTYFSRDAGISWKEVRKGSWIYEIGDHGGLLVMAQDTVATDSVIYSWDEGTTWNTMKIADKPIEVDNIIIEPTSTSQRFVVYGSEKGGGKGVMIFLDFAELHERQCVGFDAPDSAASDFETWAPSSKLNGACLLGHRTYYVRRKASVQCYNPERLSLPLRMEHCACTVEDYQCDFGFVRKSADSDDDDAPQICVPVEIDPELDHPANQWDDCYTNNYKFITKGYRKVPGDTCTGGEQWEADRAECPAKAKKAGSNRSMLYIILLLLVSSALVAGMSKMGWLASIIGMLKTQNAAIKEGYMSVSTSMGDDDEFTLEGGNDDFSSGLASFHDEEAPANTNIRKVKSPSEFDQDDDFGEITTLGLGGEDDDEDFSADDLEMPPEAGASADSSSSSNTIQLVDMDSVLNNLN